MKTSKNTSNGNPLQSDPQADFMQQLQTVVSQQIAQKNHQLAVEHIAESLQISKKTLERKIKMHTQKTAKKYLHEWRLQSAHRALEKRKYTTTKALANSFGYSNASHFAIIFKKRFGHSPKALLLKTKEENPPIRNEKNVTKK